MNIFELVGKMTIDGLDKTNRELTGLEKNVQKVQKGMKVMGVAFTAIGVAGLAIIQSTKQMNAQLGVTALNLGISTKEMRNLALETTNVTFPLKEVTATFDLLARAGVKDQKVLKDTATAFDTLGDATGKSASQVTQMMIPAMKTFGLTATEMAKKTDMMTYMSRKSTMTMEDFNTMVGYTTPELVEAGLTMEELTAILIHMEKKGYAPGRVMTREFMKATTAATKEQIPLYEAIGMTSEELEGYKKELDGATGLTQKYADVANEQYTLMDKLKQRWSEITLSMSGFLEPLEPILAGMTALGPLMIGLSMVGIPKIIGALVALKAALFALAPYAAIAGVIAGFTALALGVGKAEVKTEEYTASLKDAKIRLGELEEAGKGMGEEADNLRTRIALLTDVLKDYDAVVEGAVLTEEEYQDIFKERIKIAEKVEKKEKRLADEMERLGGKSGWVDITRRALADLYLEYDKVDGALKDHLTSMEDLSEIYKVAPDDIKAFIDELEELRVEEGIAERARELTPILKAELEKQLDDKLTAIEEEQAAEERAYDEAIEAIWDEYGESKEATKSKIQLAKDARNAKIQYLDEEADKARQYHRERLNQFEDEYRAGLDAISRGYQDQIDAIDALTEAEDDATREREDQERVAELRAAIAEEEDADKRADLEDKLTDKLASIDRRHLLDRRDVEKDALRAKIQAVRDGTDAAAIALRKETDAKITAETEMLEATLGRLEDEKIELETAHREEITRIEEERDTAIAAEAARYLATQTRLTDETTAINEEYATRLTATELHIEAINQATAELADRTITITTVHKDIWSRLAPSFVGGMPIFPEPFQHGGRIDEPTLLTRLRDMRPYGIMAEKKPEYITPGFPSVNIHIDEMSVRDDRDIDLIAEQLVARIRLGTGAKL